MPADSPPPGPNETVFQPQAQNSGNIQIGMLLSRIFKVNRFIARGGMGEVYEGVNIFTNEPVAIKFILSHLAKDPAAQQLFMEEAKTLGKLNHPALVQYRTAQVDPDLDLFYIVTSFIDGPSLAKVYRTLNPSLNQFKGLIRRLAEGLQSAHEIRPVPRIHRDVSPDNVLLPDGKLEEAKLIDFGIAKNLDLGDASVYQDGFKGRIGFAAPEQFGAYNREIGPWTDIYSLGLVALTVAARHPIDMGSTLHDAVQRRAQIPDLSDAPVLLRPLLSRMLEPDPAKRLRSMADVILALDGVTEAVPKSRRPGSTANPRLGDQRLIKPKEPFRPRVVIAALAIAATAMTAIAVLPSVIGRSLRAQADARSTPEALLSAVSAPVGAVDCSWLNVDVPPKAGPDAEMVVKLSGLAGDANKAVAAARSAITQAGLRAVLDPSGVYHVNQTACGPIDAFRQFREPPPAGGPSLVANDNVYYLQDSPPEGCNKGQGRQAQAFTKIRLNVLNDFTLLGMEPSGNMAQFVVDRDDFKNKAAIAPALFSKSGDQEFFKTCVDENSIGPAFEVLVSGKGPFDLEPLKGGQENTVAVDSDWPKRFAKAAAEGNWKTQIVWFKVQ